jgi:cadmium resistance transport/sequestration family protein
LSEVVRSIGTGIPAFVATNIDDLVLLTLFFSQVNQRLRPRHIVSGSYLGLIALVGISALMSLGRWAIAPAWIGLLGLVPIGLGIRQLFWPEADDESAGEVADSEITDVPSPRYFGWLKRFIAPQCYQVAAVTIANGGDNIGIYTPLFASSSAIELLTIWTVFLISMGIWCYGAYRLATHPNLADGLAKYGRSIVPVVLIGLGLFILWENGTIRSLIRP